MLSEKEAITILELNQVQSKVIPLGSQNNIKAKFSNGYSFHIKPDESKPGHLYAYLNDHKSGVLITWNEINHKSLNLAIKNIRELIDVDIQETNLEAGIIKEIGTAHLNDNQETQSEQINIQERKLEKKLLNRQPWYTPTIVLLSFLLVVFGYFAANRLIAVCNRNTLEMRSP
jgi:hypothetical protein